METIYNETLKDTNNYWLFGLKFKENCINSGFGTYDIVRFLFNKNKNKKIKQVIPKQRVKCKY